MVEQNARRYLQIADRGYVLGQGRDAYTGTGRELADAPKSILEEVDVAAKRNCLSLKCNLHSGK